MWTPRSWYVALQMALAALPASARGDVPAGHKDPGTRPPTLPITVTSSGFGANEPIPPEYTCDGSQTPPQLSWSKVPSATRSIAVVVDDPDAPRGRFLHWLVIGIPATAASLPKGGSLPEGAIAARNSKGQTGYTPPCPPSGRHRYVFHVYALDMTPTATPADEGRFLASIAGHVLAEGELVGTYQKIAAP